jgi:outer membrane protein assembly factor BamB
MAENELFTANEVDEQVDSYLTIGDTSTGATPASQTIKALQRHYAPDRDYSQSLDRVWGRFVQQRDSLQATSQKTTDSQQRAKIKRPGMKLMPGLFRHESPIARRLSLIAAAVFVVLLVGSMLALFQQRSSTGRPAPGDNQSRIYATVGTTIYCLDSTTYKTLWYFSMPQVFKPNTVQGLSSAQVVNGIFYVLGPNGDNYYLYALNTSDGSVRWRFKVDSMVDNVNEPSTHYLVANGAVYLDQGSPAYDYNLITAFDASSGKQLWQHRYERAPASSQKPTGPNLHFITSVRLQAVTSDMLYATNEFYQGTGIASWTRYAISTRDGSIIWQYSTQISESPMELQADDSGIYITAILNHSNDHLYAYDAKQGTEKWVFSLGRNNRLSNLRVLNGVIYLTAFQVDPKTHLVSPNATVYALRAKDGSELWHYSFPGNADFPLTVRDKTVYIVSSQNNKSERDIIAIDATTGKTRWSHSVSVDIHQRMFYPVVGKDFIYLSLLDNKVDVLRISDGSLVTTFTVEEPSSPFSQAVLIVP